MTDYRKYSSKEEWLRSTNQSHNHDYRIISIVRLLARQAAQEDYDDLLMQNPTQENKDTIQ